MVMYAHGEFGTVLGHLASCLLYANNLALMRVADCIPCPPTSQDAPGAICTLSCFF